MYVGKKTLYKLKKKFFFLSIFSFRLFLSKNIKIDWYYKKKFFFNIYHIIFKIIYIFSIQIIIYLVTNIIIIYGKPKKLINISIANLKNKEKYKCEVKFCNILFNSIDKKK